MTDAADAPVTDLDAQPTDTSAEPEATHAATSGSDFTLANAKKAYAAGVAGAVTGAGTVSLTGIFADGKLDAGEVSGLVIAVVGGFILGFVGAWLPSNAK